MNIFCFCKWSLVRGLSFRTRETVRLENLGIPSKYKHPDPHVKVTETYWIDKFRIMGWSLTDGPKMLWGTSSRNMEEQNLTLGMVDTPVFRSMIETLNPKTSILERKVIIRKMSEVRVLMDHEMILMCDEWVSHTTDSWSDWKIHSLCKTSRWSQDILVSGQLDSSSLHVWNTTFDSKD